MPDWRETDMSRICSMQDLRTREMAAFSSIPGMYELMQADPDQKEEIGAQYPDAAFATMIAGSIFNHNHQLGEITQRPISPFLRVKASEASALPMSEQPINIGKSICGMSNK